MGLWLFVVVALSNCAGYHLNGTPQINPQEVDRSPRNHNLFSNGDSSTDCPGIPTVVGTLDEGADSKEPISQQASCSRSRAASLSQHWPAGDAAGKFKDAKKPKERAEKGPAATSEVVQSEQRTTGGSISVKSLSGQICSSLGGCSSPGPQLQRTFEVRCSRRPVDGWPPSGYVQRRRRPEHSKVQSSSIHISQPCFEEPIHDQAEKGQAIAQGLGEPSAQPQPDARMPVPWEVACLIATQAFLEGSFRLGLHVLMMFAQYLRPTEALRLRCCDVVSCRVVYCSVV